MVQGQTVEKWEKCYLSFQDFFIESILSEVGFRGVSCGSYQDFEVITFKLCVFLNLILSNLGRFM